MDARIPTLALAALLVAAAVPAAAQGLDDLDDEAIGPFFHYRVDDDQDDHSGPCMLAEDSDGNSVCDILTFEAGNTESHFLHRFTLATLDADAFGLLDELAVQLTLEAPDAEAYALIVFISADEDRSGVFTGGAPQPDGMEYRVDRGNGTITVATPLASLGADIGDALQFTAAATRYAPLGDGFFAGDSADVSAPFTLQEGEGDGRFETVVQSLPEDDAEASDAFEEPFLGRHVYTWNATMDDVEATYAFNVSAGAAVLTMVDPSGQMQIELLVENDAADALAFEGTGPGQWNITLDLTEFVGSYTFTLRSVESDGLPVPTETDDPTTPPPTNGTETPPPGDDEEDERTPGVAVGLLVAGLVAAAALVRRRS